MGDVILAARALSYRYPGAAEPAVREVNLSVDRGELLGIVGPNGSGKTTLLRLMLGVLTPSDGDMLVFGRPATGWRRRDLARRVAVVVQREEPVFPLRVRQAVTLGRYPHVGAWESLGAADRVAIDRAMELADVTHLGHRWTATLSGGEWQRVRVARALAQEPEVLVLDEATASLDIRHEMEVFELMADLVGDAGMTGVLVTHRVNLAARFVDRIAVMDRGRASAVGKPADVLTQDVLQQTFGWPVDVLPWRGIPQFVPLRKGQGPAELS
jgi:iron complex transport system ATP-binding protein